MATAPQTTPYDSDRVRESRMLFGVPNCLANRLGFFLDQSMRHQRHQRKQPKQDWRGSGNRQIIPLSLSFYSHVRPGFLKGHFQSPALDKPGQNLPRSVREFGREQCLWLKLSQRVTDQHPTNLDRRFTGVIPDRRLSADFDGAFPLTIPVVKLQLPPLGFRVCQNSLQCRTAFALEPRTALLMTVATRRRIVEGGIQAERSEERR